MLQPSVFWYRIFDFWRPCPGRAEFLSRWLSRRLFTCQRTKCRNTMAIASNRGRDVESAGWLVRWYQKHAPFISHGRNVPRCRYKLHLWLYRLGNRQHADLQHGQQGVINCHRQLEWWVEGAPLEGSQQVAQFP